MNRYAKSSAPMLLALVLIVAAAPGLTRAQEAPLPKIAVEEMIEAARVALDKGELDDAEFLLKGVKPGEGDIDDLDFLHGSIALRRGDWQAAIERFRAMLARNPNLPRVRLDLALSPISGPARTRRAAYHFRLAMGDKESAPRRTRPRHSPFSTASGGASRGPISGSLALAPDNNINAGNQCPSRWPCSGCRAQLSEDARQTSGVGPERQRILGGYEGRISQRRVRFRMAAGLRTRTYEATQFNERLRELAGRAPVSLQQIRPAPGTDHPKLRQLGDDTYSQLCRVRTVGKLADRADLAVERRGRGANDIAYESFLGDGSLYSGQLGTRPRAGARRRCCRGIRPFAARFVERDAYSWREYIVGLSVDARASPRFRAGRRGRATGGENTVRRCRSSVRMRGRTGPWRGGSRYRTGISSCSVSCPRSPSGMSAGTAICRSLRLPAHRRRVRLSSPPFDPSVEHAAATGTGSPVGARLFGVRRAISQMQNVKMQCRISEA